VPAGNVEVFSWWTAGGEKDALNAVLDIHKQKFPRVDVINASVDLGGGAKARQVLVQRMADGDPPDLFQANVGADLMQWAGVQPKVEALNVVADQNGWRGPTGFFPAVLEKVSVDNRMYAVPVNIHRINALFVNKKIFSDHGLKVPETLTDLHAVSGQLLALDPPITPIVIGSQEPWTLSLLFFENLLPAIAGGQFYEEYFTGQKAADAPEIIATLEEAEKLWAYMPKVQGSRPNDMRWDGGIDYFVQGRAAMTVMGDWAKGAIDASEVPIDYMQVPFPGTRGTFIFTADTFALPIGAPSRPLAIDFLKTLASDEGQIAFNVNKGSIPARPLSSIEAFDEVAKSTILDFGSPSDHRLALSGIVPGSFSDVVNEALQAFTFSCEANSCDRSIVITSLGENYHRLKQ
jgi:glucose/mannose transport system substrate-binding protein